MHRIFTPRIRTVLAVLLATVFLATACGTANAPDETASSSPGTASNAPDETTSSGPDTASSGPDTASSEAESANRTSRRSPKIAALEPVRVDQARFAVATKSVTQVTLANSQEGSSVDVATTLMQTEQDEAAEKAVPSQAVVPQPYRCSIEPQRSVAVRERLVFRAHSHWYGYDGGDIYGHAKPGERAAVWSPPSFVFDHGDGTLDPGAVSHAYYLAPGRYHVKMHWAQGYQRGTVSCGWVQVEAQPVTFSCSISPTGTVRVGEHLEFRAKHTPSDAKFEWEWDHGDGTIDPRTVAYAYYEKPGSYTVQLRWRQVSGSATLEGRAVASHGVVNCGTVVVVAEKDRCLVGPGPADGLGWWCDGIWCQGAHQLGCPAWPAYGCLPHVNGGKICLDPPPPPTVSCSISPSTSVAVGESLIFRAHYSPLADMTFAFDHGDGTIDPGAVSHAYYEAPGNYDVTLRWTTSIGSGTIACGTVRVS